MMSDSKGKKEENLSDSEGKDEFGSNDGELGNHTLEEGMWTLLERNVAENLETSSVLLELLVLDTCKREEKKKQTEKNRDE